MASLLDWDLESEVFPTVRWLVHHGRAKFVDVVHSGLKTIFTLSPKFDTACVRSKEHVPLYHERCTPYAGAEARPLISVNMIQPAIFGYRVQGDLLLQRRATRSR